MISASKARAKSYWRRAYGYNARERAISDIGKEKKGEMSTPPANQNQNDQDDQNKTTGSFLGLGIGIGIAIGVAIGVALHQVALGIAIGVAIGVAVGVALQQGQRNRPRG